MIRIQNAGHNFNKIGIFCGSGRSWHGVESLVSHLNKYPDVLVVIAGPYPVVVHKQLLYVGSLNTDTLIESFKYCNFAISNLGWDKLNISQGSPLKSRQYLCHGLPILTNYVDSAEDFDSLKN